jgi:hypothetical protein
MALEYYRSTATPVLRGQFAGAADGIPIFDEFTKPEDMFLDGPPTPVRGGHDPTQYVPDMMAAPLGMKTIPPGERDAYYDEQERAQSSLEHVYLRDWQGPCLDQNGQGYCWYYSSTSAVMMRRLALGFPFVRLNPHPGASVEKGGRDEGGWCGLSLGRIRREGLCEEGNGPGQIPAHSYGRRTNELYMSDAVKAVREKYIVTDDWYDLGKPAYSQALRDEQKWTCLFNLCPVPTDRNIWGHSTCDIRLVRIEAGSWGYLTLNSWKNWGRRGLGVMRGSYYKADGAVSIVNSRAA